MNKIKSILSGKILAKNALINLFSQILPMFSGIIAIPLIIKEIGVERFGFITLAWVFIGYFSLFDMGLGRALTQMVSARIGIKDKEIPSISWTGLFLMLILSCIGMIIIFSITPWLVSDILNIPADIQQEAKKSLLFLGLSLPSVILITGFRALLEAYQKFTITGILRIIFGLYSFLSPLTVIPYTNSLTIIISVLIAGRVLSCMVHFIACMICLPNFRRKPVIQQRNFKPLIRFGGWMTVSNIIAPLLLSLDRFIIGSLVSLEAVAYYTTPFDVVSKMWIVPTALMGVMFPAFSSALSHEKEKLKPLYYKVILFITLILLPVTLGLVFLSKPALTIWIDESFANNSFQIAQILSIGVFVSSLAQPSFGLIQAFGRPDITAKIHMLEFPFYLIYLFFLIEAYGVTGAAIAWLIRVSVSCLVLKVMALWFLLYRVR